MSAGYVPQVGDRVKMDAWVDGLWMDVEWVGEQPDMTTVPVAGLMSPKCGARRACYRTDAYVSWVKVDKPEPWPERWVVRTMGGDQVEKATLDLAIRCAKGYDFLPSDRIRIDHYLSDGSVTVLDHTGAET